MGTRAKNFRVDAEVASAFEAWAARMAVVQERVVEALLLRVTRLGPEEYVALMREMAAWREKAKPPTTRSGPDAGSAEALVDEELQRSPGRERGGRRKGRSA